MLISLSPFQILTARTCFLLLGTALFLAPGTPSQAQIADASLAVGNEFAPFVVRLHEDPAQDVAPAWLPGDAIVTEGSASVEIPLPTLTSEPLVTRYALTVVFEDGGDGGPSVEWRRKDGTLATISEGLGEALDDRTLGLNAQTVLLPQDLTTGGGSVIVTYFGRFKELSSVTLRPARESLIALIGTRTDPALIDQSLRVMVSEELDGRRSAPLTGDVRNGAVVEAELAADIEELEGEIEFIVPVSGKIDGVFLKSDLLGLDLESTVDVLLNESRAGVVNMQPFALDDPSVTTDGGRLVAAGWRGGSLFLPSRLWMAGENRLVLKLKRSSEDPGKPVFLRNTSLHLRFAETPNAVAEPPVSTTLPYPEIDFSQASPFIEPPKTPSLPEVITTRP